MVKHQITPETLIEEAFPRLSPQQKKGLHKLGIVTARDLLYHFPSRYSDLAELKDIAHLVVGDHTAVYGKVTAIDTKKARFKKIAMAEGTLEDHTGKIKMVWYNQPYIAKMISVGDMIKAEANVQERSGSKYLANPEVQKTGELPIDSSDSLFAEKHEQFSYAIYPESRGVTSKWLFHAIQKMLASGVVDAILDPIPPNVLEQYNLPNIKSALFWIHAPKKESHSKSARKRFAFEEIFFIQLERQRIRKEYSSKETFHIHAGQKNVEAFTERFPFDLTKAQKKSINDILKDFSSTSPMSRLLEGDVGSGKTAVAASTAFAVVMSRPPKPPKQAVGRTLAEGERFRPQDGKSQDFGNLQVAYMAPTEILAKQHFESFIEYFSHLPIQVGLITGSGCRKFPSKVNPTESTNISRTQLLKWVANGEIPILIGTHSLIQKSVQFKHLAYVIIDEQHRFGIKQRSSLIQKNNTSPNQVGHAPHLLSMTATPIPRTLALTMYGDLDLTVLDEMPHGRLPVKTSIVPTGDRKQTYESIRKELEAGRQMYVICPRIDEPDPEKEMALQAKSVKEEAKRLKKDVFPEFAIDIMHSKMKPSEKDEVMERFSKKEIDILVSTSVVEVGVSVANATIIIIEGAERFGLAQLHQLRGRVQRSSHQPYCYVFTDSRSKVSIDRLRALTSAKNGFELAELDLGFRGAGVLTGDKQWGVSDMGMEALRNLKMVEAARTVARDIIERDPKLTSHPLLRARVEKSTTHME